MLTADYLASLPDELVAMLDDVDTAILQSVIERVQKTKALSASSIYQLEKLNDLGKLNSEVAKNLARALNISQKKVKQLLQQAGIKALSADDAIYKEAGLNPAPIVESAALRELLSAGIQKTNGLLKNFTGTTAQTARLAYSNVLDRAYLEVTSGAYTYDEATRRAVTKLAKEGVSSVAYPSGGFETIESSIRKCISTGVNQTIAAMQLSRAADLGSDLVEVTSHAGARPSHAMWQGGIYSISGRHKKYKPFDTTTGYGTIGGLCGVNCYHSFYPYLEGVSSPSFSKDPAREFLGKSNDLLYEQQQRQRAYERRVRESKRECAAFDTALSNAKSEDDAAYYKAEFDKAAILLKKRRRRLNDYVASTGGVMDYSRTMVGGFNRSVSSRAVWADKKAIRKTTGSRSQKAAKIPKPKNRSAEQQPDTTPFPIPKMSASDVKSLSRASLETVTVAIYTNNAMKSGLSKAEGIYRSRSLMSGNTDAQLRKYIIKHLK